MQANNEIDQSSSVNWAGAADTTANDEAEWAVSSDVQSLGQLSESSHLKGSDQGSAEYIPEQHRGMTNWELTRHQDNPYQLMESQHQHVYLKPGSYIGVIVPVTRRVYGYSQGKIFPFDYDTCEGVIRLLIEAFTNATDNIIRSRLAKMDFDPTIYVTLTLDTITVRNSGQTIPIKKHPDRPALYNPEVIFGILLSSGNYSGERVGAGINGYGVKLANIFSTWFEVQIGDPETGLEYKQVWENNMRIKHAPEITSYTGAPYVQVSYRVDFARFGLQGYTLNDIAYFSYLAAAISLTQRSPVILQALMLQVEQVVDAAGQMQQITTVVPTREELDFSDPVRFAMMAMGHNLRPVESSDAAEAGHSGTKASIDEQGNIVLVPLAAGTATANVSAAARARAKAKVFVSKRRAVKDKLGGKSKIKEVAPNYVHFTLPSEQGFQYLADVVLMDTPYTGQFISFVNGPLPMHNGGDHIEKFYHAFGDRMLEKMKEMTKTSTDANEVTSLNRMITIAQVKKNVSMLICTHHRDPEFADGQSKTRLGKFPFNITLPPQIFGVLASWSFIVELGHTIEQKMMNKLCSTDGSKKKNIVIKGNYDKANWAGSERSAECTLWLAEGNSAATFACKLIGDNRDNNGVFALRGKVLNVMNASLFRLWKNREYTAIKTILGLRENTDYANPANREHLRYGNVVIIADADYDGIHIQGLCLNMFYRWPSLIQVGSLNRCRTAMYVVSRGNQVISLYNDDDMEQFLSQTNNGKGWVIDYKKGLGSNEDADIEREQKNLLVSKFVADEFTENSMRLGFDRRWVENRKQWLSGYTKQAQIHGQEISITTFILSELAIFSLYNLKRALPNIAGQKPSYTKIIYTACQHWHWKYSAKSEFIKVAPFSSKVAEMTLYHHGETSLQQCITGMASDFVGSGNNLPYLEQKGQFGSRRAGGQDAASPRYTRIRINWWVPLVFREADKPLLQLQEEEGDKIEPVTLLPTIPILAINGIDGIGTGWSTWIAPHHPIEVTDFLVQVINGKGQVSAGKPLQPWYRGFTGNLYLHTKHPKDISVVSTQIQAETQLAEELFSLNEKEPTILRFGELGEDHSGNGDNNDDGNGDNNDDETENSNRTPDPAAVATRKAAIEAAMAAEAKLVLVTEGRIRQQGNITVVEELPVGTWSIYYSAMLAELVADGVISNYRVRSKVETVHIEITWPKNIIPANIEKILQLKRKHAMTYMYVLDQHDHPVRYDNIEQLIVAFYKFRLPYYYTRKVEVMRAITERITELRYKIRLIDLVLSGELVVQHREEADIFADLARFDIPEEVYKTIPLARLNATQIRKSQEKIVELQREYAEQESSTPEQIWLREIEEFVTKYCSYYPRGR